MPLVRINVQLVDELEGLSFSTPVAIVYNPLVYAREPYEMYLRRFGGGRKEVVFVGMNPGPWGMAQTGVPFGEVRIVREWLRIRGAVGKPAAEHPKKRIEGFACPRSEVSGKRLWGLIRQRFETPDRFFRRFLVLNHCPLLFLSHSGANITPDRLPAASRDPLLAACDRALRKAVEILRPRHVIGIGNFAADRATASLAGLPVSVGRILHPSPSNPAANRAWEATVLAQLREQGVEFP